jgi:purine nucleoside permease
MHWQRGFRPKSRGLGRRSCDIFFNQKEIRISSAAASILDETGVAMRLFLLQLFASSLLFLGCASVGSKDGAQAPKGIDRALAEAPGQASSGDIFTTHSEKSPLKIPVTESLSKVIAPKVLIVTLFAPEAKSWLAGKTHAYAVEGAFSPLYCDDNSDLCMMISGRGIANTAASMLAVGSNPQIDLRRTYIIEAGIGGGRPGQISLGSVAWVEWAANGDSGYRFDRDELPKGIEFENFRYGCLTPWCQAGEAFSYDNDIFHLNHDLIEAGLAISKTVKLADNDLARKYRLTYPQKAARNPPGVQACDLVSGDTFFHGKKMSDWASWWLSHWSENKGVYCVSAMEEPGLLLSLKRLSASRRIDFSRVMILRSVANYDQPRQGQTVLESLGARSNGHEISFQNVFLVGSTMGKTIIENWAAWEPGVPAVK